MANYSLHHEWEKVAKEDYECKKNVFGKPKNMKPEFDKQQSTLGLKTKILDLSLFDFPDNVYNEDNSFSSDESEDCEDYEIERIRKYQEHLKGDSGYDTIQHTDQLTTCLLESATFDFVIAKTPTNYRFATTRILDQNTICAKKFKASAINDPTIQRHRAKRKLYQEDEAFPTNKKEKFWNLPSEEVSVEDSRKATVKKYTKIFLEEIEEALMNGEKFSAEIESKINILVSSVEKSLLSENDQFYECPEKFHPFIEKTFKLLSSCQIKKPMSRENGTYLMHQLCDSPIIRKKIYGHLIREINKLLHRTNSIICMNEVHFLGDLLEISAYKFQKVDKFTKESYKVIRKCLNVRTKPLPTVSPSLYEIHNAIRVMKVIKRPVVHTFATRPN